ncbi:hypothetical protein ACEPAH_3273 [Sanghuangporus vaninii]
MEVWCLLVDHEKKAAFGDLFSVIVSPDARIQELKKKVKEERPDVLEHVVLATLTVWRCMNPKLLVRMKPAQLKMGLSSVDFTDETKTEELGPGHKIMELSLSLSEEIVLIEVPGASRFFLFSGWCLA